MPTVANSSPLDQSRQQSLLQRFVATPGDPSAGAGPLREDERRRETGRRERHVAADRLFVAPTLSAPLGVQEPLVHAGLATEPELLGRPLAAAIELVGPLGKPSAKFAQRWRFRRLDFEGHRLSFYTTRPGGRDQPSRYYVIALTCRSSVRRRRRGSNCGRSPSPCGGR